MPNWRSCAVTTHNVAGVEYAKLSETKEGDTLIADDAALLMKSADRINATTK